MLSVYQFAFILLSWSPVTWWHDDMALVSQTAWQMAALSLPRDIMRSRECRHQHHTSTYTKGASHCTGAAPSDARYPAKKTNKTDAMFWSVDVVVSVRRMSGEVTENHHDHLIYGLLRYFCVLILIFWIFLLADKLWADYPGLAPVTDYSAAVMC